MGRCRTAQRGGEGGTATFEVYSNIPHDAEKSNSPVPLNHDFQHAVDALAGLLKVPVCLLFDDA